MKKVLIIDDDAFLTALYVKLLREEGLEVDAVNSGEEGLERLGTFNPNLVVLDLQMPGMTGIEVLRIMRSRPKFKRIPVVVFATGYAQSLASEVDGLGVLKVLSKMKYRPRLLVQEINKVLEEIESLPRVDANATALEIASEHIEEVDQAELPTWMERLRSDDRIDARRICLLHIFHALHEEIYLAISEGESTPKGKLGKVLKRLLDDLYDHPDHVSDQTVEALEKAIGKLRESKVPAQNAKLESEAMLKDLLKGLGD